MKFSQFIKENFNIILKKHCNAYDVLSMYLVVCKGQESRIQHHQLTQLFQANSNFMSDLVDNRYSEDLLETVQSIVTTFDEKKVSSHIYSYYMYEILKAMNIETDVVEWINPLNDNLEHANGSFGTGSYVESIDNYTIQNGVITAINNVNEIVTIPNGISGIASDVFSNTQVVSVTVPSSVKTLKSGTFASCNSLTSVILPDGIDCVAKNCFNNCTALSNFVGGDIKRVLAGAFNGSQLESVTNVGENIEYIASQGFANCHNIREIDLSHVKMVDKYAFSGCENAEQLTMAITGAGVNEYKIYELFEDSKEHFKSKITQLKRLIIECKTGEITEGFFEGCEQVESIQIIGEVTKLGEGVFKDCISLKTLSMEFVGDAIPANAFVNCNALQEIPVMKNVVKVGANAFSCCGHLQSVTLASEVVEIGESAFYGCTTISKIDFIYTGEVLEKNTFNGCSSLADWTFIKNATIFKSGALSNIDLTTNQELIDKAVNIEQGVFYMTKMPSTIVVKSDIIYQKYAFEGVQNVNTLKLDTVKIAESDFAIHELFTAKQEDFNAQYTSITRLEINANGIEEKQFQGYINIKKVTFGEEVTAIPNSCFINCDSLYQVVANGNIESVGDFAFQYCKKLNSIKLGENVNYIGISAFQGCTTLSKVDCVFTGKTLSAYAFESCIAISNFNFLNNTEELKEYCLSKTNLTRSGKVFAQAKVIEGGAFYASTLPSVLEINSSLSCERLIFADTQGVETLSISQNTIYNKDKEEIQLFELFDETWEDFIGNHSSISGLKINGDTMKGEMFQDWCYIKTVEIGEGIKEIPKACFENCNSIEVVTIQGEDVIIGERAFYNCLKLRQVSVGRTAEEIVKDTADVAKASFVGKNAFENCECLTGVIIDIKGELQSHIFKNCYEVNSIGINSNPNYKLYELFDETVDMFNENFPNVKHITLDCAECVVSEGFFEGCNTIEKIEIKGEVTSIHKNAFKNCTSLQELTANYVGDEIEPGTFENCEALTVFPTFNSVTKIGANSFKNAKMLSEISFADKIETIGESAFENAENLKSITTTYDGEIIEANAFGNCSTMENFSFITKTSQFKKGAMKGTDISSVSELIKNATLIEEYAFGDSKNCGELVLNSDVIIAKNAFNNAQNINSLVVENSCINGQNKEKLAVYEIFADDIDSFNASQTDIKSLTINNIENNENAFSNWNNIEKVTLSKNVKTIEKSMFEGCQNLVEVELNSKKIAIKADAFNGCSSLKTVANKAVKSKVETEGEETLAPVISTGLMLENATEIGENAFLNCTSLEKVEITPNGVTTVEIFKNCTAVNDVTVYINEKSIKNLPSFSQLFNADIEEFNKLHTAIASVSLMLAVSKIPTDYFSGCSGLQKIDVQGEVDTIGSSAFSDCTALTELQLNYIGDEIKDNTFKNCSSLEVFPSLNNVVKIGERAFENCRSAKEFTFEKPVEYMGEFAFNSCVNVEAINMDYVGEAVKVGAFSDMENMKIAPRMTKVTACDVSAFHNCVNVTKIAISAVESSTIELIFSGSKDKITDVEYHSQVIPKGYFANLTELKNIDFKNEITVIGERAFENDANYSQTINSQVMEYVGDYAYKGTSIENIILPSTVEFIGKGIFAKCEKLKTIELPMNFKNAPSLFSSEYYEDGVEVVHYDGTAHTAYYLPKALKQISANGGEIGKAMFSGLTIDVSIDEAIDNIADYAFCNFKGILYIETKAIKNIGLSAFEGVNINAIYLDSVENIGDSAFKNSALEKVNIGGKIEKIGVQAFSNTNINELNIEKNTRYKCNSDMLIDIVSKAVIYACASLKGKVKLGKDMVEIAPYAFESCGLITEVDTVSVEKIGDGAFQNCDGLTTLNVRDKVSEYGSFMLSGCSNITKLNVPYLGRSVNNADQLKYLFNTTKLNHSCSLTVRGGELVKGALDGVGEFSIVDISAMDTDCFIEEQFTGLTIGKLTVPKTLTKVQENCIINSTINEWKMAEKDELSVYSSCLYYKNVLIYCLKSDKDLKIKDNTRKICENAFDRNSLAESLTFGSNISEAVMSVGALKKLDRLQKLSYSKDGEQSISNILDGSTCYLSEIDFTGEVVKQGMFASLPMLKQINMPNVKEIGDYAFKDAVVLRNILNLDNVEKIGKNAFENCLMIGDIHLGDKVEEIEEDAFDNTVVENITIGNSNQYEVIDNMLINKYKSQIMYVAKNTAESITIPEDIVAIRPYAFAGCENLREINIESDVIIGERAFHECHNLESVNIRFADEIGLNAFEGLEKLVNVDIVKCNSICDRAFANCGELVNFQTKSLSVIGNEILADNEKLKTVKIANDTKNIGTGMLQNCNRVKEISVPFLGEKGTSNAHLTYLFGDKFITYQEKKTVDIPESLTTVELTGQKIVEGSFYKCKQLDEVILGRTTTYIKKNSFQGCAMMRKIVIPLSVTMVDNFVFLDCDKSLIAVVRDKYAIKKWGKKWNVYKARWIFPKRIKVMYQGSKKLSKLNKKTK